MSIDIELVRDEKLDIYVSVCVSSVGPVRLFVGEPLVKGRNRAQKLELSDAIPKEALIELRDLLINMDLENDYEY